MGNEHWRCFELKPIIEAFQPLFWPVSAVIIAALIARAIITVARVGIRVEIFTQAPIAIKTGYEGIEARVTKVRL